MDGFPKLYRLEFNQISKTLSVDFVTKFPCNVPCPLIICKENEISVFSSKLDWLYVYDIRENSWSIKKWLTMDDSEQSSLESFYLSPLRYFY